MVCHLHCCTAGSAVGRRRDTLIAATSTRRSESQRQSITGLCCDESHRADHRSVKEVSRPPTLRCEGKAFLRETLQDLLTTAHGQKHNKRTVIFRFNPNAPTDVVHDASISLKCPVRESVEPLKQRVTRDQG